MSEIKLMNSANCSRVVRIFVTKLAMTHFFSYSNGILTDNLTTISMTNCRHIITIIDCMCILSDLIKLYFSLFLSEFSPLLELYDVNNNSFPMCLFNSRSVQSLEHGLSTIKPVGYVIKIFNISHKILGLVRFFCTFFVISSCRKNYSWQLSQDF